MEYSCENQNLMSLFVNEICLIFDQHEFQLGPTGHQGDSMCEVSEL